MVITEHLPAWMGLPALTLILAGCSPEAPPKSAPPASPRTFGEVDAYLPLKAGTVLAYNTLNETSGEEGTLVMEVKRPRPDRVELSVGGKITRLDLVAEGAQLVNGGWLLRTPLETGASFKGQFGAVRITKTKGAAEVPAGNFNDCITTVERSPHSDKEVTTTFCRDVGIVKLDVEGSSGEDYVRERATLRYHGPKIDIGADLPPPPPRKR